MKIYYNALAFPPETNFRFATLVAVAAIVAFSQRSVWDLVAPFWYDGLMAHSVASKKMAYLLESWIAGLVNLVTAAVAMLGFYLAHPIAILRKQSTRALENRHCVKLVESAADKMMISAPLLLVGSKSLSFNAQVFGRFSQKTLLIQQGLMIASKKQPEKFRAIVLHELAHISNGDVWIGYGARALIYALLLTIVVPTFAYELDVSITAIRELVAEGLSVFELRPWVFVSALLPLVIFSLLLRWQYGRFLWHRELLADSLAATVGARNELRTMFARAAARASKPGLFRNFFDIHPSVSDRLTNLESPILLFGLKFFNGILSGMLICWIYVAVVSAFPFGLFTDDPGLARELAIAMFRGEKKSLTVAEASAIAAALLATGLSLLLIAGAGWDIGYQIVKAAVLYSIKGRNFFLTGLATCLLFSAAVVIGLFVGAMSMPVQQGLNWIKWASTNFAEIVTSYLVIWCLLAAGLTSVFVSATVLIRMYDYDVVPPRHIMRTVNVFVVLVLQFMLPALSVVRVLLERSVSEEDIHFTLLACCAQQCFWIFVMACIAVCLYWYRTRRMRGHLERLAQPAWLIS